MSACEQGKSEAEVIDRLACAGGARGKLRNAYSKAGGSLGSLSGIGHPSLSEPVLGGSTSIKKWRDESKPLATDLFASLHSTTGPRLLPRLRCGKSYLPQRQGNPIHFFGRSLHCVLDRDFRFFGTGGQGLYLPWRRNRASVPRDAWVVSIGRDSRRAWQFR